LENQKLKFDFGKFGVFKFGFCKFADKCKFGVFKFGFGKAGFSPPQTKT